MKKQYKINTQFIYKPEVLDKLSMVYDSLFISLSSSTNNKNIDIDPSSANVISDIHLCKNPDATPYDSNRTSENIGAAI